MFPGTEASNAPHAGQSVDVVTLQQTLYQQQQQLQHLMQQQQQQLQSAPRMDMSGLAAALQQQQAAMQQQQAAMQQQQFQATAQLLSLQALGQLPAFTGKGASTGLAALEWLQHAERYFAAREAALGITAAQGDGMRATLAANALQEDAQRWYNAMPLVARPTTWKAFREALLGRYSSVPAVRVRVEQLRSFVDAARRVRDKMTLEGWQNYMSRFQQLAGEIPDSHVTAHGKLELLARGLPPRLAEAVLVEDAKDVPSPLHEIAQRVLAKAAFKEYAGSISANTSAAAGRPEAMELDAIALCATQFGVSREEAQRYVEPQEGWAVHETRPNSSSSPPARSPEAHTDEQMERLLAAFESRYGKPAAASGAGAPRTQSKRRNVPGGVRSDVPEALATARREAGLCIKCGVAKYEPGGKGHNSRTCKTAEDKTTSAAEGKKKAGF